MRLSSLRSKIFLLVGLTLVVSAIAVQFITERNVTNAVVASEKQSVNNVLNLLFHDSEARWSDWLNYKITAVRNDRAQLVQSGHIIHSVLSLYADRARQGEIATARAQQLSRHWLSQLHMGGGQHAFIFDRDLTVIASDRRVLRGMDLSTLKDFKGHDLAASAYSEANTSGHSFAIYRRPLRNSDKSELRYAYFVYFQPWDWVFVVSGDAREVVKQLQARRRAMEDSISVALQQMQMAQSGFVFIVADDGRLIAPPPGDYSALLGHHDVDNNQTLRQLLGDTSPGGAVSSFAFSSSNTRSPWEISAVYFKPLGWTIAAAVPRQELHAPAIALRNRLFWVFLLALFVSLAIAWLWSARLARPLRDLADFARKLPEQDLNAPANIPEHIRRLPQTHTDEVGHLADTFMYMDRQLREKIATLLQETSSRERFESELNIAHAIQMGLLPTPLPADTQQHIDLHATMTPAKQVGGDLYDYFVLADGRLCIAIGDVSDKGVPAALFMAVTRTLIRATAEDESDPARMAERINNRLSANNPNLMFVTLIVAILDLDSGELHWASAGHLPPCVVASDGSTRLLNGRSGPACGVLEDIPYQSLADHIAAGEMLVAYTDGVTEAHNPAGEQYGETRLFTGLGEDTTQTAAQTTAGLLDDVNAFAEGAEQFDDITLIAVKRPLS